MAAFSLLKKDLREHWKPVVFLYASCVLVFMLLLNANNVAAYSMSTLDIVRQALLYFLPLVALIIGNRLIVKEYLSGTRLFVEALPLGTNLPLLLKYFTGLFLLLALGWIIIYVAVQGATPADDITQEYLLLIVAKTSVVVWLYWAIVFCFSLCGFVRFLLYFLLLGVLIFIVAWPGIDSELVPPIALLDAQLFIHEREEIPWTDMIGTAGMALGFSVVGFFLTKFGDGSVIERLSKPMTRSDFVAIAVLLTVAGTVGFALVEDNERELVAFTSEHVIRVEDPEISVLYLEEQYKDGAQRIADRVSQSLTLLQASLGLESIPRVQLAFSPGKLKHEFDYRTLDGVFVSANWLEHDSYDDAVLDTVMLHGVMSLQTRGRAAFEPYHWVLDGFTRWWTEQATGPIKPEHKAELIARALWVLDRDPTTQQLVGSFQLIADRFAYPSAEALSWAAVSYIEERFGRDVVLALASEFLASPVGTGPVAWIEDRWPSSETRLENILGISYDEFTSGWMNWLNDERTNPDVQTYLQTIPSIQGVVTAKGDDSGVYRVVGQYEIIDSDLGYSNDIESLEGLCSMKHEILGPFDNEFEVGTHNQKQGRCQVGLSTHVVDSTYTSGDRVFIAMDYSGGLFHQDLRIHSERIYIP